MARLKGGKGPTAVGMTVSETLAFDSLVKIQASEEACKVIQLAG